jgi:Lrp/AsnC family transcriptional regulator, leucine-responsive regulatory protein
LRRFLIGIHAASAERLETLVDGIAGFGAVTTSLVLRSYPPKPTTP